MRCISLKKILLKKILRPLHFGMTQFVITHSYAHKNTFSLSYIENSCEQLLQVLQ